MKTYYIYILASKKNGTLYTGTTSNLIKRIYEHKQGLVEGFTKEYDIKNLVYYEIFDDPKIAIQREKTIKNLLRIKKNQLITGVNPTWKDLYPVILERSET